MTKTIAPRNVRKPQKDRVWSPEIADKVLEIVGQTGSPKMAAEKLGISTNTIHDHRRRDYEFGERYGKAMDAAFHEVLGKAFERSMDTEEPSDRLIEILLKFRWPVRLNGFVSVLEEPSTHKQEIAGLDPRVISQMPENDRNNLIKLLETYLNAQEE